MSPTGGAGRARSGEALGKRRSLARNLCLQPKSAFSRFAPVQRADVEGRLRVDLTRSPNRPATTAICAFETFERRLDSTDCVEKLAK